MDDIKFHENGNDHCWISEDMKWIVILLYSEPLFYLYKNVYKDGGHWYDFTGFKCDTWQEIQDYIKNHQ